jgi:hypothetical protein
LLFHARVPSAPGFPRFLVVLAMVMLLTVCCVGLPFFGFLAGLGTSIVHPTSTNKAASATTHRRRIGIRLMRANILSELGLKQPAGEE